MIHNSCIAHIDVDAFFASVLVRKNPRLGGKPLLALGMGGGCVIAASYEAKAKGVRTGMRLVDALTLTPDAIRIPSDFHEAARASHEIESILGESCPIVEQMSIDEWFLDLPSLAGGLPKNLEYWAKNTQQMILKRTALTVSVGVAPSKLLAKMASEYRKPAGITVIGQSIGMKEFLCDRPAAAIPGIGKRRNIHAEKEGWKTAWDIAQAPTEKLLSYFGRPGVELQRELLGESLSQVTGESAPPKSVSRCRSFKQTKSRDLLWAHLLKHLEYTVLKMRRHELMCKGISVWLRLGSDHDYDHCGANASLPQPSQTADAILPFMHQCMEKIFDSALSYTQVGLALWHLVPLGASQFSLFDNPKSSDREESIQKSLDSLHQRFGRNSITRGSALSVKSGTNPMLDVSVYDGVGSPS